MKLRQVLSGYYENKKSSKGFTLIELLVVIAILGVMAAMLVAAIDPFEQIKKSQDTSLKDLVTEFNDANVRYYANHSALPWFSVANGGANCYTGGNTLSAVSLTSLGTCIQTLVSDGELKQAFSVASNLGQVVVTNPNPQTNNATDSIVCFLPQSKSQQKDPNTKYNQSGALQASGCKSQGGAVSCYWCAQ